MGFFPFSPPGNAVLIPPSGDQSGAADVKAINEVIANGGFAQLAQAPLNGTPYYIRSPLLPATLSGLAGVQPWASSANDNYGAGVGVSGGTTIYAVAGFTGAAMISMVNDTGTQYSGVSLVNLCLEGFSTGGSGARGILCHGAWGAGFIGGCCVHRPDQDCIRFEVSGTTGKEPDEWILAYTKASASRNGYGLYADNLPDSILDSCNLSENNLDGAIINWSTNTRLNSCKGENNGGAGFHLTGQGHADSALHLTGCTTHLNNQDGFFFDDFGGGTAGNYLLANCFALDDNQAGGAFASYRASGCPSRIMGSNCLGYGAAYGAYEGSSSFGMCFTGSYFSGTTAATHDDGTNTHALVNQSPVPF